MTRYKGSEKEKLALDAFIGLMRSADRVSSMVHGELDAMGLSVSQFGVLEALYHLGPMCQKEIAGRILKSSGNITMVVGNLEKRGLVLREQKRDDRRFFTVRLTPAGELMIRDCFPGHVRRIVRAMDALTDDELHCLMGLCRKLRASNSTNGEENGNDIDSLCK